MVLWPLVTLAVSRSASLLDSQECSILTRMSEFPELLKANEAITIFQYYTAKPGDAPDLMHRLQVFGQTRYPLSYIRSLKYFSQQRHETKVGMGTFQDFAGTDDALAIIEETEEWTNLSLEERTHKGKIRRVDVCQLLNFGSREMPSLLKEYEVDFSGTGKDLKLSLDGLKAAMIWHRPEVPAPVVHVEASPY